MPAGLTIIESDRSENFPKTSPLLPRAVRGTRPRPCGVNGVFCMSFYIAGTGSALPEKVVTNDDLAQFLDTSDEWIVTRTGIRRRHVLTARAAHRSRGRVRQDRPAGRRRGRVGDRPHPLRHHARGYRHPVARLRRGRGDRHHRARVRSERRLRGRALLHGDRRRLHLLRQGQNGARRLGGGDEQAGRLDGPLHLRPLRRRRGRHAPARGGGPPGGRTVHPPGYARHPHAQHRGEQPL